MPGIDEFRNPDGTYDGAAALSAISGIPKAGIPSNAYYSNAYTASYRYRIDQNWAMMAQVMRIEGSNTEITGRSRQDVTNRYGLCISYSW